MNFKSQEEVNAMLKEEILKIENSIARIDMHSRPVESGRLSNGYSKAIKRIIREAEDRHYSIPEKDRVLEMLAIYSDLEDICFKASQTQYKLVGLFEKGGEVFGSSDR